MSDDSEPFFSSGEVDSISDEYPYLKSLNVSVEISKGVDEQIGYKGYDENDLVSHIECPECGKNVSIGWVIEDYIDAKKTAFEDRESCGGQLYEGKSCLVTFNIEGTAEYV
jgi:hypothetical protein